jgi:DNA-binding NarL/FixJ family response regulator
LAGVRSRSRYCFLISGHDTTTAAELSRLGASGLLHKRASGRHLVEGLRRLAQGNLVVDPVMAELLMANLLEPRPCREHDELTERDLELLRLLGEGRTNREIAQAVFLSEKTVKNYLSRLFRKLGVRSRTEAALLSSRLASGHGAPGPAC